MYSEYLPNAMKVKFLRANILDCRSQAKSTGRTSPKQMAQLKGKTNNPSLLVSNCCVTYYLKTQWL